MRIRADIFRDDIASSTRMQGQSIDLTAARGRIVAAYDAGTLRTAGQRLIDTLAEHLARVESRETKVLNWNPPKTLIREARVFLDRGSNAASDVLASVVEIARETLARGQNMHHPHYVGHQVPAPLPLAGLFDLIGAVTNQVMAIYEMGPWATAVEH